MNNIDVAIAKLDKAIDALGELLQSIGDPKDEKCVVWIARSRSGKDWQPFKTEEQALAYTPHGGMVVKMVADWP